MPLITTLLAFLIGGLVVVVTTGHNPLSTYKAIFNGTGLNWFFHPGATTSSCRARTPGLVPVEHRQLQSHDAYASSRRCC